ncbi:MAG: DinB family protein [Phycisphaerales bacterium]
MTATASSYGSMTAPGCRMMVGLADGLLNGVDAAKAGTKPDGVDCNTPTFVLGHLAVYPDMILQMLGEPHETNEQYQNWFKHGVECQDDPDNTIYPPLSEVLARFKSRSEAAIAALEKADDELLASVNPNENMRERLPTIGAMATFLLSAHVAFHLGQLSTWRRCMGLGSAMG